MLKIASELAKAHILPPEFWYGYAFCGYTTMSTLTHGTDDNRNPVFAVTYRSDTGKKAMYLQPNGMTGTIDIPDENAQPYTKPASTSTENFDLIFPLFTKFAQNLDEWLQGECEGIQ